MAYLPILDELFSSDSVVFVIIGIVVAVFISIKIAENRKKFIGMMVNFLIYVVCEAASNIHINYAIDLALLIIGAIAVGLFLGFLIGIVVSKIRK